MPDCPFCRIAAESSAAATLLQSDLAIAFADIRPIRPGHALIVPRRHEADFWSLTEPERAEMMTLAKRLADAQRKLFKPVKIGMLVAGFDVAHAHLHVLPLYDIHDVTAKSILDGTLKPATPAEMDNTRRAYAGHFNPGG